MTNNIYRNVTRQRKCIQEILCEMIPYVESLFNESPNDEDFPCIAMFPDLSEVGSTKPITCALLIQEQQDIHLRDLFPVVQGMTEEFRTTRAILLSETWSSTNGGPRPSLDPERKEILLAILIPRTAAPTHAVFWDISRSDGRRILAEPVIENVSLLT
jgi:hypothetical protein